MVKCLCDTEDHTIELPLIGTWGIRLTDRLLTVMNANCVNYAYRHVGIVGCLLLTTIII